jgi:hypothetical protein
MIIKSELDGLDDSLQAVYICFNYRMIKINV